MKRPRGGIGLFYILRADPNVPPMPNAEITALVALLTARGDNGWELVQFQYHKNDMICFWKREVQEDRPAAIPPHSGGS